MDEIVDDAPKVNQVAEEEGKPFDALLFSKGWELKPVGINVRRQGQGDVGGKRVKVDLTVQAQERVGVFRLVLKRDAERGREASHQPNFRVAFRTG